MRSRCLQCDKLFIAKTSIQQKISNSSRDSFNTAEWNTASSVKLAHQARFCVVNQIIPIETSYLHKISLINVWELRNVLCHHILLPLHVPAPPTFPNPETNAAKQHESGLQENLIRRYKRNVRGRHSGFNRQFDASASLRASFLHWLSFHMFPTEASECPD